MIYIVLDTSIFVKVWTQSQPGNEIENLEVLAELGREDALRIVVPEIVSLEIESNWQSFPNDFGNATSGAKSTVEKALEKLSWNEIEGIKPAISTFVDDWKLKTCNECEQRYKVTQQFLAAENVIKVAFTPAIMCEGKKLMINGSMPKNGRSDQDAFIVQSLICFFELQKDENAVLFFCSSNLRDFSVETKDGISGLRLGVRGKLPSCSFFGDLGSLVKAAKDHQPIMEPALEEVREAENEQRASEEIIQTIERNSELDDFSNTTYPSVIENGIARKWMLDKLRQDIGYQRMVDQKKMLDKLRHDIGYQRMVDEVAAQKKMLDSFRQDIGYQRLAEEAAAQKKMIDNIIQNSDFQRMADEVASQKKMFDKFLQNSGYQRTADGAAAQKQMLDASAQSKSPDLGAEDNGNQSKLDLTSQKEDEKSSSEQREKREDPKVD